MFFILYNSGAGGNLVSAVIDSTDYIASAIEINPTHNSLRQHLKVKIIENKKTKKNSKNLFFDGNNKTSFLKELEQTYMSVTTEHDVSGIRHHVDMFDLQTIVIDDTDDEYNKWGMNRCYTILPKYHPMPNEQELIDREERINLAKTYKNSKVISLKDILEGRLITKLQEFIDTPLNTEIYNYWLSTILPKTPFISK
jgi:hypothetical protein